MDPSPKEKIVFMISNIIIGEFEESISNAESEESIIKTSQLQNKNKIMQLSPNRVTSRKFHRDHNDTEEQMG